MTDASIFPGTGIPKNAKVSPNTVMICGESPAEIFETVKEHLAGWQQKTWVNGFREFSLQTWTKGSQSINVFVGGLGSASVELILQEGTMSGMRNFILTGSCASLRSSIVPGEFALPSSVVTRPGAVSEYFEVGKVIPVTSPLQQRLIQFARTENLKAHQVKNISTDAFYGIGAAVDADGKAVYAGAPLKNGRVPAGVSIAIQNVDQVDTLDMEAASFFALGEQIEGIEVAAIKVVSNPIPWNDNFDQKAVTDSLVQAVRVSLSFALTL